MGAKGDRLFEVHVRFPITFTVLGAVMVVVLSVAFYQIAGSWKETLIFFAAASAATGTIATALYTGRTLNLSLRREGQLQAREDRLDEFGRKERALRFAERWSAPGMHYARDACREVYQQRGRQAEEIIEFANESRRKVNITNMLNFFEEMAFAIEYELATEDLMKEQFCGVVTTIFTILKPWIDSERVDRGRPNIWIKVERMYTDWC